MKVLPLLVAAFLLQSAPHPPTPADFGQFERLITAPDHGGLSPDGRWLAYGINRTSGDNDLRVTSIADGTTKTIAFGTQQTFSSDSKWLAAAVGVSEAEQEKLRKARKPMHRKLALLNLSSDELTTVDGVESFAFSADGHQLLMRRYAPERAAGGRDGEPAGSGSPTNGAAAAGGADPEDTPGVTAIVRDLTTGRDTTFGNIVDAAWQTKGKLLALAIGAEDRTGDGVQVFDPVSGSLRVLDSGPARYVGLSWRKDADDLAVLKSIADDRREGLTYAVLAWTGVGGANERKREYNPTSDHALDGARRVVAFRHPSWAEDGAVVFVGVASWSPKVPVSDKGQSGVRPAPDRGQTPVGSTPAGDDRPTVDVWHPLDVDVMPKQKVGAPRDRQRNLLAAWTLDKPGLTILGHDFYEQVVPLKSCHLAYAVSWTGGALERSWGQFGAATISLVDVATGQRTKIVDQVDDRHVSASPEGTYILYFVDGQIFTIDTWRKTVHNISKAVPTSFVNQESDSTDVQKPFYGQGGWTKDDRDILLYDKFDVWQVAGDGSKAAKLTDGAAERIEYRVVRLDPDATSIDRTQPLYFDMTGERTKKSGIARLAPGAASPERLLWVDKSVTRLARAKDSPVYTYVSQTFEESPNAFVGGADLKNMKQVTTTNAFQSNYAW